MKRVFAILIVAAVAISISLMILPVSAAKAVDRVTIYLNDEPSVEPPKAVKVGSVNELKHYLDEYHQGIGLDFDRYDKAFFQESVLLFTLAKTTGSSPCFEIFSVEETETSINVKLTREDMPTTPDMASWILVVEMDRDAPEREILVDSLSVATAPYRRVSDHVFVNDICTICGAIAPIQFTDVQKSAWYADAVTYAAERGLMRGVGDGQFAPEETMTRAMLVTVLWRYVGSPEEWSNSFRDVRAGQWYTQAVSWAAKNGIVNGTSPTTFDPDSNMTRAMLVTVLWRLDGNPAPKSMNSFKDVPGGQWYTEAVAWASENGVVDGVGNNLFDPDGNVTREQIAAIMYRYAGKKGYDTTKRADLSKYPDAGQVSSYAKEALSWANAEGLINGTNNGKGDVLDPKGSATRAQVATILMRYVENILQK